MIVISTILVSLVAAIHANPVSRGVNMVLHEARQQPPTGFVMNSPAPSDTMLNLRLALVSNNMAGLEKALYDVSTPSSPLYGQHLSKEEVEGFVKPAPETTSAIQSWLSSNGVTATTLTPAGEWMSISVPVSRANELFAADFSVFTHQESGQQSIRTLAYSIPATLKGHLELVHPTTTFTPPRPTLPIVSTPIKPLANLNSDAVPSSCASVVTPACLQALYGIPATRATQPSNQLAVSGFIQQFANQQDLNTFLINLRPDLPANTSFTLATLDGGTNPQGISQAGIEANLDIQYTVGVASGVPTTFISVGGNNQDGLDGFIDIINSLNAQAAPPQVLTTSYGFNEPDLSSPLANNLCNAHMALGARGVSILFASGDGGVSGSQSQRCTTFIPTFPSGCPFTTSVGATTGITETSASFSSGGFSNIFPRPSYQNAAVTGFLNTLGKTNAGKFNTSGRAFPDIAAQGENVEIVLSGTAGLVAGTSCSSPIFASIISLLNDELIAAGKSPLGFLNPLVYGGLGAAALNDITTGNNPGCNTNGFSAVAGWDPVTGFGTPNFQKLRTAVGL